MHPSPKFLVVDRNPEGLMLLERALLRKFKGATIVTCSEIAAAVRVLATERITAVVTHRALGMGVCETVGELRKVSADVPIVAQSGTDHSFEALAAGASAFLHYDAWLMLGTTLFKLLNVSKDQEYGTHPSR